MRASSDGVAGPRAAVSCRIEGTRTMPTGPSAVTPRRVGSFARCAATESASDRSAMSHRSTTACTAARRSVAWDTAHHNGPPMSATCSTSPPIHRATIRRGDHRSTWASHIRTLGNVSSASYHANRATVVTRQANARSHVIPNVVKGERWSGPQSATSTARIPRAHAFILARTAVASASACAVSDGSSPPRRSSRSHAGTPVVVAVRFPMTTRPAASKHTVTVSISRRRAPVESLIKAMRIFACPSEVRSRETVRLRMESLAITPDATPCRRARSGRGRMSWPPQRR